MNYIGGPLELTPAFLESQPVEDINIQMRFANNTVRWTASGRSGLALILEHWRARLVDGWILLPDYMCWDSMMPVFQDFNVKYASVNEHFVIETSVLENFISDQTLRSILLIDYFGLCDLRPQIKFIRELRPDILILIDAVQAFCSLVGVNNRYFGADAVVSSPRKVLPIPDGGLVIMEENVSLDFPLPSINSSERVAFYLAASVLRERFVKGQFDNSINNIVEPLYVNFFNNHGKLIDSKIEAISPISMEILRRTNLRKIAKKRSKNFDWMQNSVREGRGSCLIRSAFPETSGAALAFPVKVTSAHRNKLREFLKHEGFFCPVHWPVPKNMMDNLGKDSIKLSDELLSLPIDQRYSTKELSQLLDAIERYIALKL
jgi:dTDP-4-amino-4,6-dideoxygalactose transaminase